LKHTNKFSVLLTNSPVVKRLPTIVESESRSLITNSAFLIATTLAGSCFGFLFWLAAAHCYTPEQVGVGAACISAVALLSALGEGGLSTALIRFAPGMGSRQVTFINSALIAAAACTLTLSGAFALGTPVWAPELGRLASSGSYLGLFLLTTMFFSLGQLLDNVFIAFQATQFMFVRNLVAAVMRLVFLLTVGRLLGGMGLWLAVGVAALVTLGISTLVFVPRVVGGYRMWPLFSWSLLRDKAGYALGNHFGGLLLSAPALIYPLIVVALLGAKATAYYYTSSMIAGILLIVPDAVSRSAFARSANRADRGNQTFWQTLRRTLIIMIPITVIFILSAPLVLRIFGEAYVAAGSALLSYLGISAVPNTIIVFVIVYHRIHRNTHSVVWISGLVAAICLLLSIGFAAKYGLVGIGIGWLAGQVLGVVIAVWTLRVDRATKFPVVDGRDENSEHAGDHAPDHA
jgi:O-antigen/teichoic acid export membrane protein